MSQELIPYQGAGAPKRRLLSPADNQLVRAVGRVPAGVHVKLLVAFVGTALLVVVVGVLGLRILGQSNERVETLRTLQVRAFAYGKLRSDATHVRLLLAQRVGGDFYNVFPAQNKENLGAGGRAIDQAIASAAAQLPASTFPDNLGFRPPPEDERFLRKIRATGRRLASVLGEVVEAGGSAPERAASLRERAELLAIDLNQYAAEFENAVTARTDALIVQNASAYEHSRNLFIGVAAGAIVLALLLGFVLSWSAIGPIQRINSRLAAIASGDFSGHVDVTNRDELGALAANVNQMNDELRRLYREVETASQHKSDFLANMSHELRTPLNSIIGFSQVLREGMAGDLNKKQAEYIDDILSSGTHLLSLINDVLDLSKVEAGQIELHVAPFSLQDALERGISMVREQATAEGVQVTLQRNGGFDVVSGDERRIRQVIFNLLSNAVKFTPEGGEVDVSAARIDGEMRVSVADSGPGVAEEDIDRIFEEFQQTEAGARQGEGTGLGLALSKRFVEMHGGRIWCESEVGKGSTFEFTLPLSPVER
ncbi:MAG TPA: HAMP domain-containing sensor histidine kinase [Gaiellaceae bacterium]|nr:HAMP domain-containing sensor histidine kinase [Gaiellaceae bacterium]